MQKKIKSIQSIRFIAFLIIFFHHANGIINLSFSYLVDSAVEYFFILSGFLMVYNHWDEFDKKISIKEQCSFAFSRIKKFYFVFIIAFFIKAPITIYKYWLEFGGSNFYFYSNLIIKALFSLALIQSFIPNENYYFAFNGVAWFLDDIVFFYVLTPRIINFFKNKNIKFSIIIVIILKCLIRFFACKYYVDNTWQTYISPFYRIFDYIFGCLISFLFIKDNRRTNERKATVMEILIVGILLVLAYSNILKVDVINMLVVGILIYIFAKEEGKISKGLNNTKLEKLGNISMEMFMLHQPIIKYFEFALKNQESIYLKLIFIILSFILTWILAQTINKIRKGKSKK